jgi:hypothetical protein
MRSRNDLKIWNSTSEASNNGAGQQPAEPNCALKKPIKHHKARHKQCHSPKVFYCLSSRPAIELRLQQQ